MNIYYIGGSPCSGKSTVAEILSQKYGLHYFKVDDFLDHYTKRGALAGYPICKKIAGMSAEEIWMRDPKLQCREEFEFYKEIFEYVLADLTRVNGKHDMITEGAAYVPELIKNLEVPNSRYISITPTKEFQIFHYKKREFVPHVLEGCADKEKAFCNWMDRDILFAQEIRRQCDKENYVSIVNDGKIKIDELADRVALHFGVGNSNPLTAMDMPVIKKIREAENAILSRD